MTFKVYERHSNPKFKDTVLTELGSGPEGAAIRGRRLPPAGARRQGEDRREKSHVLLWVRVGRQSANHAT